MKERCMTKMSVKGKFVCVRKKKKIKRGKKGSERYIVETGNNLCVDIDSQYTSNVV